MKILKCERLKYINAQINSRKFYNLSLTSEATILIRYGRIGTNGNSITKQYEDQISAENNFQQLLTQKLGKGYVNFDDPTPSESDSNCLEESPSLI